MNSSIRLIYVSSGKVEVRNKQWEVKCTANSLFILPCQAEWEISAVEEAEYKNIDISTAFLYKEIESFESSKIDITKQDFAYYFPHVSPNEEENVRNIAKMISEAKAETQEGEDYRNMLVALLCKTVLINSEECILYKIECKAPKLSERLFDYLANHLQTADLTRASQYIKCNPSYLSRQILRETGENFNCILKKMRLEKAAEMLKSGCSEEEVVEKTGFESVRYFRLIFKKEYGKTPLQYAKPGHPVK